MCVCYNFLHWKDELYISLLYPGDEVILAFLKGVQPLVYKAFFSKFIAQSKNISSKFSF